MPLPNRADGSISCSRFVITLRYFDIAIFDFLCTPPKRKKDADTNFKGEGCAGIPQGIAVLSVLWLRVESCRTDKEPSSFETMWYDNLELRIVLVLNTVWPGKGDLPSIWYKRDLKSGNGSRRRGDRYKILVWSQKAFILPVVKEKKDCLSQFFSPSYAFERLQCNFKELLEHEYMVLCFTMSKPKTCRISLTKVRSSALPKRDLNDLWRKL